MKNQIKNAFESTNGIVEHEFSESVVSACKPRVDAIIERISSGKSTFEAEDALLMAEWKKLKTEKEG